MWTRFAFTVRSGGWPVAWSGEETVDVQMAYGYLDIRYKGKVIVGLEQ